jgi:hypothetical protein
LEEHTASIFRAVPLKRWYLATSPHSVTSQKTNTDMKTDITLCPRTYWSYNSTHSTQIKYVLRLTLKGLNVFINFLTLKVSNYIHSVLEVGRDGIQFLFEKPRNHPSAF